MLHLRVEIGLDRRELVLARRRPRPWRARPVLADRHAPAAGPSRAGERVERRHLGDAGRAPGRPEIDQQRLALEDGEGRPARRPDPGTPPVGGGGCPRGCGRAFGAGIDRPASVSTPAFASRAGPGRLGALAGCFAACLWQRGEARWMARQAWHGGGVRLPTTALARPFGSRGDLGRAAHAAMPAPPGGASAGPRLLTSTAQPPPRTTASPLRRSARTTASTAPDQRPPTRRPESE